MSREEAHIAAAVREQEEDGASKAAGNHAAGNAPAV